MAELIEPTRNPDTGIIARSARSIHLGVITADMGIYRYELGTCEPFSVGENGELLSSGSLYGCSSEVNAVDCDDEECPWLLLDHGIDIGFIQQELSCLLLQGDGGCGIERHFDAFAEALTTNSDPGEPNNGFVREGAILAVIFLSNEDDCSASTNEIYDYFNESFGPMNTRCAFHPEALRSVGLYREVFDSIIGRPEKPIVLAGIIGIPVDGSWSPGEPIDELYSLQSVDPENPQLLSGLTCEDWHDGRVYPSPRLAELIMSFGSDGYLASMCEASWEGIMLGIARTIQQHLL